MPTDIENAEIRHNQEATAFEVFLDGRRSWLEYVPENGSIVITHVIVHPDLRGQGLAERLMRTGLEYARRNSLRVIPQCAYAQAFFRRHPEEQQLLK
jgi:predicted GNAT family acetyltransferase